MGAKNDDRNSDALQEYVKLMTQHQWAIRGYILSLMPGSPDVADVLQETNLVLWQKQKRFKLGTNFLAWASSIARYEVMHHRDRAKRLGNLPFSDELFNILAESTRPDTPRQALLSALDACLEKLNDRQRAIIEKRYTPGMSLEAYASELGSSAGGLRVILHRIRQSLKRCVEGTLNGESA